MDKKLKECPYCGEEILETAKKCKHCGEFLDETAKPKQEFASEIAYKSNIKIKCPVCGYEWWAKKRRKGSWFVEFVLYCFFFIPWMIYSSWRWKGLCSCPKCWNKQVISKWKSNWFRRDW